MDQCASFALRVEEYSGYKADEHPLAFWLGGRRIQVREVLDRWCGEDHAYFKLTGEDGILYILRHDGRSDTWDVTLMEAPSPPLEEGRH